MKIAKIVNNYFNYPKDLQMNYRSNDFKYPSNRPLEVDIYIPSLNLAFEYQVLVYFVLFYITTYIHL
jgi:hypothetical protein